jgi:hypothetical protein
LRIVLRLAAIAIAAFVIHLAVSWLKTEIAATGSAGSKFMLTGMIFLILLVYAMLIALPFVPGIEIGLALIAMQGTSIGPYVYLFTVIGLSAAYLIGQFIPYKSLHKVLSDFGLKRIAR